MASKDLDPNEALVTSDYEDPTDDPITDESDESYVAPAEGIKPLEEE